MLTGILPSYRPSSFFHAGDEFFTGGGLGNHFQDGDCAFSDKALLGIIDKKVVFVFAPCGDLTLFDNGAVKMMTFFSNGQPSFKAKAVGKFFLLFKIAPGLMQLPPINIGNTVGDDMTMQVVFILMHTDHILMIRKKPFCKFCADFKDLLRCHLLVFVEADDVMGIHPPGVFIPEPLLGKPGLIDFIIVNGLTWIRTGDFDITLFYLFVTKDVFEDVPHGPVAFC